MAGHVAIFRTTSNAFTPGTTSHDRADMVANVDARGITGEDRLDVVRRALVAARECGLSHRNLAVVDRAEWEASWRPGAIEAGR